MKPQVLIIADNDLTYGIKHGYYPQMIEASDSGQLEIVSIDSYKTTPVNTKSAPLFNGKDIYLRNPYTGCYISMDDKDILNELIDSRSIAVKEALVRMGAKNISLNEETSDTDKTHTHFNGNANIKLAHANIDADYEKSISVNIKSKISYDNAENKPRTYETVRAYLDNHGLSNDYTIVSWLERLREDGRLTGHEVIDVTFFSEIQSALRLTSSIDYKLFSIDLDFSSEHNHVHTITKTLNVNFG